jgi:hypothetical protein
MPKPGYRTSEFWFTLVSFIFSGLFLLGLIGDNDQKEELIRDVSHGVESVILIGGQLLILYNYINARKVIKSTAPKENSNEQRPEPEPDSQPEPEHKSSDTTNQPGFDKKRSRKTSTKSKRKPKRSTKRRPS